MKKKSDKKPANQLAMDFNKSNTSDLNSDKIISKKEAKVIQLNPRTDVYDKILSRLSK